MKRRSINRDPPPQQSTRELPKRAARIIGYQPGSRWRLDGAVVTVLAVISVDRLLVRHASDDRTETVLVSRLVPIDGAEETGHRQRSVADYEPRVWSRALKEQAQVSALVARQPGATAARVARALNLSERQLRRKVRRYTELNTLDAFLPQRPGPAPGSTQLHRELERLIHEEIVRSLKVSADIGVDDLLPILVEAARALDLRPPSRATLSRRLRQARRRTELLPADIGHDIAYRNKPVRGAMGAEAPLSVVEMDHTVCDVHLIEPVSGYPIGRPVLTLMIDRATRVVLGMLLSLEAPSRLSVGLCLHHGVFPKQAWLNGLGLPEGCWPGFGLIGTLYTDNGGEFHAQSLRRSAQIYGIELAYRPPKDPAAGGIIERALGTFLRKIRLIPGTSYSRWLGEKPRRAERAGCFTLQELELYLARQVSVYHKTRHRTLGMPPVTAWERAWVVNGARCLPQIPDSSDLFLLTFLPGAWRTITREGVALFGLRYQSPELLPLVQKDVRRVVRFDPRNLSRVFVETESAHVPVDLADHHGAPFSWWEWCERKAWRRSEGRPRDPQTIAAELRANRALITERAGERGRWRAARRQAREAAWRDTTSTASHATWILKSALMPDPSRCRVEE